MLSTILDTFREYSLFGGENSLFFFGREFGRKSLKLRAESNVKIAEWRPTPRNSLLVSLLAPSPFPGCGGIGTKATSKLAATRRKDYGNQPEKRATQGMLHTSFPGQARSLIWSVLIDQIGLAASRARSFLGAFRIVYNSGMIGIRQCGCPRDHVWQETLA